jgi:hypothetical protein
MPVIFSTCWYLFKAKFDPTVFQTWIHNMLSNVNNYYLVVYTDEASISFIRPYESNPRIKIIKKPMEEFYNYKYREQWIQNHMNNHTLREKVDWRVNMLWSEKIHFVEQTINDGYFIDCIKDQDTIKHGWCDIGYFRGRKYDMNMEDLKMWPNNDKINALSNTKIHYGCVNNNTDYINHIFYLVNNKNENRLPIQELPPDLNTIGGGFFILHRSMIEWWRTLYDTTLEKYFKHGYLVKDDQTIITDCIFSNLSYFLLHSEENTKKYDIWFPFQRLLQ